MALFDLHVKENRVGVRGRGDLVDRNGDDGRCAQSEESMSAGVEADCIVNLLVEVFENVGFGGLWAKPRWRYSKHHAFVTCLNWKI